MGLNLYDIVQEVLNEAVNSNNVTNAIQDRRYVEIMYSDEDNSAPGKRLIQPYAYGVSTAGNALLRAFQVSGDSLRGRPHWKTFRLDRVTSWKPRKQQFNTPPPMQGYKVADYNSNGDESMAQVYLQVSFDNIDTSAGAVSQKSKDIKTAPKISSKNTSGPINAWQQWKKNVYTSQPNSKKYSMYAKNIDDTSNEINRFDDDIWAKAEAERQQQENDAIQKSAKMPKQNQQGPIDTNNVTKIKNKDEQV